MKTPKISQGARDDMALVKSRLGWLGRIRLRLGALIIVLALYVSPPELREVMARSKVHRPGEEE